MKANNVIWLFFSYISLRYDGFLFQTALYQHRLIPAANINRVFCFWGQIQWILIVLLSVVSFSMLSTISKRVLSVYNINTWPYADYNLGQDKWYLNTHAGVRALVVCPCYSQRHRHQEDKTWRTLHQLEAKYGNLFSHAKCVK